MEMPGLCASIVHQYGGRKIVQAIGTYFGYVGELLFVMKK